MTTFFRTKCVACLIVTLSHRCLHSIHRINSWQHKVSAKARLTHFFVSWNQNALPIVQPQYPQQQTDNVVADSKSFCVCFLGAKQPGSGVDHPQTCSAQVKEKVELYLYSRCSTLNVFIFIWIHVPHGQVSAQHTYFIHTPVNTIWHSHKHITRILQPLAKLCLVMGCLESQHFYTFTSPV